MTTWNPLFDNWRAWQPWAIDQHLYSLAGQPRDQDWDQVSYREIHPARRRACNRWSWAVPSPEAVTLLAGLGPIVEVGAGTGYWARLISDAGGDIIAYDRTPPIEHPAVDPARLRSWCRDDEWPEGVNRFHPHARQWFDVCEDDGVAAAAAHPDRTLFLCWPPYDRPFGADALRAYHAAGGRRVIYVGEGSDGCTGDADLHALLGFEPWCRQCESDESCGHLPGPIVAETLTEVSIPRWDGIRDFLVVLELSHDLLH